jgi:hypothetical protein
MQVPFIFYPHNSTRNQERGRMFGNLSHFQNSISFENGFGKTGQKPVFSGKSRVAFSKTEVLKKPHL